jgi:hypothetical protein
MPKVLSSPLGDAQLDVLTTSGPVAVSPIDIPPPGGSFPPVTTWMVDPATAVAIPDQTGSLATPFGSLTQVAAQVPFNTFLLQAQQWGPGLASESLTLPDNTIFIFDGDLNLSDLTLGANSSDFFGRGALFDSFTVTALASNTGEFVFEAVPSFQEGNAIGIQGPGLSVELDGVGVSDLVCNNAELIDCSLLSETVQVAGTLTVQNCLWQNTDAADNVGAGADFLGTTLRGPGFVIDGPCAFRACQWASPAVLDNTAAIITFDSQSWLSLLAAGGSVTTLANVHILGSFGALAVPCVPIVLVVGTQLVTFPGVPGVTLGGIYAIAPIIRGGSFPGATLFAIDCAASGVAQVQVLVDLQGVPPVGPVTFTADFVVTAVK